MKANNAKEMTDDELLRVYLVAWNETTMNVQDRDAYALRAVFEAGARAQPCVWTPDDDGVYWTACDNGFTFIDAGPKENHMKFCCYCGGALVEAPLAKLVKEISEAGAGLSLYGAAPLAKAAKGEG